MENAQTARPMTEVERELKRLEDSVSYFLKSLSMLESRLKMALMDEAGNGLVGGGNQTEPKTPSLNPASQLGIQIHLHGDSVINLTSRIDNIVSRLRL